MLPSLKEKTTIKKLVLNYSMLKGKKLKCYQTFKKSAKVIQKNLKKDFEEILKISVSNSLPVIYTKKQIKKKGKQKILQEIPFILSQNQRIKFSVKYILSGIEKKMHLKSFTRLCLKLLFNSKEYSFSAFNTIELIFMMHLLISFL